jgi:GT2 family glycosyltransferase
MSPPAIVDPPLVSIVTPCLDGREFVEDAIESVRRQTYPRLEHVIVDGGSTDGTLDVLARHPHLRWRSEPDRGQADAVNKGIGMAKGEILGWLNADDLYEPDTVAAAVVALERQPAVDLVYGVCRTVDRAGRTLHVTRSRPLDPRRLLTSDLPVPHPALFFRRRLVDRIGLLDPELHLALDFDYWLRAARAGRCAYAPAVRATLRHHAGTKSARRYRDVLPETLAILDRAWRTWPGGPPPARLRREALAGAVVAGAIRAYLAGDRPLAGALAWRGLRTLPHPFRRRTLKALLILADARLGLALFGGLRAAWQARDRRAEGAGA